VPLGRGLLRVSKIRPKNKALSFSLLNHVIDYMTMLMLGAKHYDFRIFIDHNIMPGWPVKQIVCINNFLDTFSIGCGKLTANEIATVRALAQISLKSHE